LLNHESTHVLQNRLAGKYYTYSYAVWLVGVGGWFGSFSSMDGRNWWRSVRTFGYSNNPWEIWAYEANNPGAREIDAYPDQLILH
jgi:hypothetical protein